MSHRETLKMLSMSLRELKRLQACENEKNLPQEYRDLDLIETITTIEKYMSENFWDCECAANYIHSKSIKNCDICQAEEDEQPDSIPAEFSEITLAHE